ncbi:Far upstream element-binding protein 2 [Chelonia mydas]|uniref:Far upstream element-binding protein 2 n=1 Tax=Chelonia mydas TaxID=8469 RepID=M7AY24_CHEMY|nr:Far upstream element-binding protein 2 [Chelonia mydas]
MGCFSFLKMMMFVFNGIIFLGGLAVLGIGIWMKVDGGSFVQILGAAAPQLMQLINILGAAAPQLMQLINVGYLCIAVGTFLLLMGFLGCCGAMKESKCMLLLFFVIILILFIAEVTGAVVVLAFSSMADIFIEHLKTWAVKTLREDYGRQDDLTAIWDTTMKELKCCGFNNYKDFNSSYFYQTHSQTYPAGCCLPPKRECLESELDSTKKGCLQEFQTFLSRNGRIVGGVALGIGVLEKPFCEQPHWPVFTMAPSRSYYATLKTVMICFNTIIFVVGCTMVALGLWIKLGSTSFVRVLGSTSVNFVHIGYFCIVVGIMVAMLGFIGCWGAVKESRCLLRMYFLIMLVIFIAEITAAVVVFAFTQFARSVILDKSLTALKKKYSGYKHDDIVSYGWNAFMLKLNCCGVHNYTDFSGSAFQIRTNLTYPKSCCKDPMSSACNGHNVSSVVINQEGCFHKLVSLVKEKSLLLGGAATGAALLEVPVVVSAPVEQNPKLELQQIAAKIGGDAATTVNNNTPDFGFGGQKRQLEDGDQPESKKLAAQGDSMSAQLGPIHPPPRSTVTEEYRVPDGMVGLIIGRGGEQINKIQQDSGCKVQISPDSGGLPERSVSLTGSPESVQKAKMMLDDIVSRGRGGPPGQFHDNANGQNGTVQEIMIPAGKAGLVIGKGGETIKQLQERAGVKMILIQDGSQNTNVDKPLRIIGDPYKVQKTVAGAGHPATETPPPPPQCCCREAVVGRIITTEKQQRFSAAFQRQGVLRLHKNALAGSMVPVGTVLGIAVLQACEMVMDILRERDQGGFGDRNEYGSRIGGGIDVPVPRHSVGVVIGRSGEMIKKIQNDAGVRIQFKQDDGTGPEKIAHIMGPPDRCEHAARIINDLLQSLRVGGENVKAINQQTGAFVEISRQLPPNGDPNFKLFIIRGSPQQIDHAKQLIEEKIEGPLCPVGPGPGPGGPPGPAGPMGPFNPGPFNPGPPGAPPHPGAPPPHPYPPQGWGNTYPQWQPPAPHDPSKAAAAADPNAAWAAYYSHYYQQPPGPVPGQPPAPTAPPVQGEPPQPPPAGQSDYTKAWEEYYKKLGQQPQQPGAPPQQDYTKAWEEYYKKQAAQVATGGGPGAPPGPQPDYSAAWAEYYRQQAAYYGQTPGAGGPVPPPTQQGQQVSDRPCAPLPAFNPQL